jgi:uncharacterized membrane protein
MTEPSLIHDFLKNLTKYLSRLDKPDAEEVIREIECHILDAIEQQEQTGGLPDAKSILEGFGEPRELANQYVEHLLKGTPPPEGFKAIQRVKKEVTKTIYYSMGFLGFGISICLLFLGLGKLFMPDLIGVWSAAQGNSVIITFSEHTYLDSDELFGYWLSPFAIVIAVGIAHLTKSVLKVLKQSTQ